MPSSPGPHFYTLWTILANFFLVSNTSRDFFPLEHVNNAFDIIKFLHLLQSRNSEELE